MKKKYDCKMEETIKDILKRLKELEKDKCIHEIRILLKEDLTYSDDTFVCQDCGKTSQFEVFSFSSGYCDDCYTKNHSVTSSWKEDKYNPLNPQRRIKHSNYTTNPNDPGPYNGKLLKRWKKK